MAAGNAPIDDAADAVPAHPERRAEVRLGCSECPPLRLVPRGVFKATRVTVHAIGRRGITLISPMPLECGTRVALLWEFGDVQAQRTLTAVVRHACLTGDARWRAGCAFDTPLGQEDVWAILAWRR